MQIFITRQKKRFMISLKSKPTPGHYCTTPVFQMQLKTAHARSSGGTRWIFMRLKVELRNDLSDASNHAKTQIIFLIARLLRIALGAIMALGAGGALGLQPGNQIFV